MLMFSPSAVALTLGGVGIKPSQTTPNGWFVYQLGPQQSVTDAVLVNNGTDTEQVLQLAAVDSQPTDIGAFGLKGTNSVQVGIGKWVRLSSTKITLAAGQSKKIPFTLSIPAGTASGEYSGAITVQQAPQKTSTSGAFITTRVAVRIYNTVGSPVKKIRLQDFSVVEGAARQNYDFTVKAKNDGNVSIPARLVLRIEGYGIPTDDGPDPDFTYVATADNVVATLERTWQIPLGSIPTQTYMRWRKPYFGRFQASVTIEYDGEYGQEKLQSSKFLLITTPWFSTTRQCLPVNPC